jgi:hypothetical protein
MGLSHDQSGNEGAEEGFATAVPLRTACRMLGHSESICNPITDGFGRSDPTNGAPTPHRRAISRSDQPAHSGLASSVSTALRLSPFDLRHPCSAFALTLCGIASAMTARVALIQ